MKVPVSNRHVSQRKPTGVATPKSMSRCELENAILSRSMGNVQTWPPVRVATQNGKDDGTEVTSTPNVKQNEIDGRESSGKMRKKRKRRTLKHLVRMCEKFGDNSDKSGILARWRKCLKDPRWQYAVDAGLLDTSRMEDMIQQHVIKLENLSRELHNQGGASGKVRDVARERFWEASPLTRVGKFEILQLRDHSASLLMLSSREYTEKGDPRAEMDSTPIGKLGSLPGVSDAIRKS